MASLRRNARERKEFLYRKSLENKVSAAVCRAGFFFPRSI